MAGSNPLLGFSQVGFGLGRVQARVGQLQPIRAAKPFSHYSELPCIEKEKNTNLEGRQNFRILHHGPSHDQRLCIWKHEIAGTP